MQDENIRRMTENINTVIDDIPTLNILLCYLLYKIDKPVEVEQLYEIAIGTGIVNYFFYQESVNYLAENGHVIISESKTGNPCYILQQKGIECAKQLRKYVSKTHRDKLVLAALRYFARLKNEQEIKIEYIPLEKGYYTHVRCLDVGDDLMDLKLYAPDMTQAQIIGERIMLDPAGFYGKVVELALSNKEPDYDLTDN